MTIYKIRYIAAILFIISPFVAFAQQQAGDSISIFELIDAVEKNTSCRIYTTIAEPFKVKKAETLKPTAESLRQALTATRYKVTVYGNRIFVLPEAFLSTTLTPILKGEQMKEEEQASSFIPVVKSSSENKVYEIGNRYKPSSEEMVVLTGKVTDFKSGQNLEGINIVHREPWVATATDRQGNFTIKLPIGYNTIEINGLNIKETRRQFMVYGEGATHIELEEENHLLDEVLIVSGRVQNVRSTQLGMEKFQPSLLKNIPTAMGEVDLLKMLQTLPGIKTVGEASSGYNVRGSAADQNLLLLNNGTIYNPNHLFGFFTAFNSDMIKDAELYKSSIPSQYGGRIASVLNITSKEASKERNKLNIYGYYSHDRFAFNDNQKYAYNNMNFSANWRSIFSEKLTANFSFGYDHYDYRNDESVEEAAAARLSFAINQWFGKVDFSYKLDNNHTLNFGLMSQFYNINSGTYEPLHESSLVKWDQLQKDKALESAIYIGDQWEITPKLSVNAGIRYSMFNLLGPRTYYTYQDGMLPSSTTVVDSVSVGGGKVVKTYQGPEFRLSARYAFNDDFSVKAGFNTMRQYIHKVSNTTIMSPTDTWKLSDTNIKPQNGWQLAAGAYYNTPGQVLELSVEGYYKKLNDYLDYRSSARLIMNHHLETDVINTEGYAYGVEFQVKKPSGKLNGWASYTYSRTFLRQNDPRIARPVNGGDWYPTEYDKPHDFKLVGNYKFTRRYSVSFNMDYSTGRPTTIPAGQYYDQGLQSMQVYYTDRNSYRVPDYFRLDLAFNIEPSHHLTLLTHSSISFGVYNLTGRKNVYSIYYVSENGSVQGYKMSIFGAPIPFITYNIKF